MRFEKSLVFGIGVNDSNYSVNKIVEGKQKMCPFYRKWVGVIRRCYSKSQQRIQPSYIGCSVCEEWLTFSNFKKWMEQQDWQGKELDKDILVKGNKIYSPETCVFVDKLINRFFEERLVDKGDFPTGVSYSKVMKSFLSQTSCPFTKKRITVGYFKTPEEAHSAWKAQKLIIAKKLADTQKNEKVKKALLERYL